MSGGAPELCCGAAGAVLGAAASVFAGGETAGVAVAGVMEVEVEGARAGFGAEYAPGIGMGMGVGSGSLLAGFHASVVSGCVAAGGVAVALVSLMVLALPLLLVASVVPLVLPRAAVAEPTGGAGGGGALVSMDAVEFGAVKAAVLTGLESGAEAVVAGGNNSASMA